MPPTKLADWLAYQEQLHPRAIDMGLERLQLVLAALGWTRPHCPVITVGGTNGKGSCVALIEAIYTAAGYRVGVFTSPHLMRYNERIRVAGRDASDAALVAAFDRIEAARGSVSLTFFEFNALAALLIFADAELDAIVLEVGLGGRMDAVNVVDADVAIVSSVALDHCEWLGADRESIGREKAGIFRGGRPAIFGDASMPLSVAAEAQRCGARLMQLSRDFDFLRDVANHTWTWIGTSGAGSTCELAGLPEPQLYGAVQFANASTVLCAIESLQSRLPVARTAIEAGMRQVRLAGRFQVIATPCCEWVLDVAHNPAAAATLADNLAARVPTAATIAICGMLADKDVRGVLDAVRHCFDSWVVSGLHGPRALDPSALAAQIDAAGGHVVHVAADVASACEFVDKRVASNDASDRLRVVVFGSFHTVGPALQWLRERGIAIAD